MKKIIITSVILILFSILIIFIIDNNNKKIILENKEDSFKYYHSLNFNDNINTLRKKIYNNSYFNLFVKINNYNGKIDENNIGEIMNYYIVNITKNKNEVFETSEDNLNFCLSKKSFISSFKELFDKDITEFYPKINILNNINAGPVKICFNYDQDYLYDYSTLIYVKDKNIKNEIIELSIYEYIIDTEDVSIENNLNSEFVKNLNYNNMYNYNENFNNYGFQILEKKVKFKEIRDGNFFKYQLISINTI
ncbi:MAG: hypothetical protein ACI32H_03750 [Bacilli bacterium]